MHKHNLNTRKWSTKQNKMDMNSPRIIQLKPRGNAKLKIKRKRKIKIKACFLQIDTSISNRLSEMCHSG